MVTRVFIIRHCEAEGNISEVFQGSFDSEITEKGELQLQKLSERFKNIHIDTIVSSPLKRAYKTAQAINKYKALDIQKDEQIVEINGGEYEGHKWSELHSLFPDTYKLWLNDFANFCTEHGESMTDVYKRMSSAITKIVRYNPGRTVAVVSHGGAIKNLLCFLDGKPLSEIESAPWTDNTSVSCYDFYDNAEPKKVFVNDCSHLDTEDVLPHSMWWRKEAVNEKA